MDAPIPAGLEYELRYVVPPTKTVPHLYPDAPEFAEMPEVLATGFLVGLVEWACIRAIAGHLDHATQLSLGTDVSLTHAAATPPGMEVVVRVRLDEVEGRRLRFSAVADDERDRITEGTHERFVVDRERFLAGLARKRGTGS